MKGWSKAVVAAAHTNEKHRSPERVLLRAAIALLGGMRRFVKAGDTFLLKPNLTVFNSAEEDCTTDPQVVGALIRLVKEAG